MVFQLQLNILQSHRVWNVLPRKTSYVHKYKVLYVTTGHWHWRGHLSSYSLYFHKCSDTELTRFDNNCVLCARYAVSLTRPSITSFCCSEWYHMEQLTQKLDWHLNFYVFFWIEIIIYFSVNIWESSLFLYAKSIYRSDVTEQRLRITADCY